MAKQTKKFGIGSTLKKKVALKPAVSKDIERIEEKVAKIHSNEPKAPEAVSKPTPTPTKVEVQAPKPTVRKTVVKKVEKKEEMKRLTIDIPKSLHRKLKSRTAEEDVSIKDLLNKLILKYVGK